MRRRLLLLALLAGGLAVLIYSGVQQAAVYYVTVAELRAQGPGATNVPVRVAGTVEPGSIEREGSTLRFTLSEGSSHLPVVYRGVVTDLFKDGAPVVVEGVLRPDGVFSARVLLAKCPTKYEPATP